MNNGQNEHDQLALAVLKAARDSMGVSIDAGTIARVSGQLYGQQQGAGMAGPGVLARLKGAIQYVIDGVLPTTFMSPMQPLRPQQDAPERGVVGRQWDFPVGLNLRIPPRAEEQINFQTLRGLAEDYDLMRGAIETCKDQIESFEWQIVPKDEHADPAAYKDDIKFVTDFFTYPDKEHNWPQWLRMVVEDMLVIDAVGIYPNSDRAGNAYSFDLVDAGTIRKVIDEYGRTPVPPSPAYQQVIKGIPAVDYTREQLIYVVRNPRTWKNYGYSPVEQCIVTVNIAMRRQLSQLQFYTEGNVPEALVSTPDSWNATMVKDFQDWWDQMMVGNTAERRRMKFVPNLGNGKIIFPKEAVIKDEYDEWLAKIVCWFFSISSQALQKQMNRASSEQMAETAKQEGQMPRMRFIASQMNRLIEFYLKRPGVVFSWQTDEAMDPLKRAQASQIYLAAKVVTPDETRADDLGKAPLTEEQKKELTPPPDLTPPPKLVGEKQLEPKGEAGPTVKIYQGDTFVRVTPVGDALAKVERRAA